MKASYEILTRLQIVKCTRLKLSPCFLYIPQSRRYLPPTRGSRKSKIKPLVFCLFRKNVRNFVDKFVENIPVHCWSILMTFVSSAWCSSKKIGESNVDVLSRAIGCIEKQTKQRLIYNNSSEGENSITKEYDIRK